MKQLLKTKKISEQDESPGQRKKGFKNMSQTNIHKGCNNVEANFIVFQYSRVLLKEHKGQFFLFLFPASHLSL